MCGWIKNVLSVARINTENCKGYSICSAFISKAALSGLGVFIIPTSQYSNETTWQKCCNKSIEGADELQSSVLN